MTRPTIGQTMDDAALDWAIRARDPAFEDWDGLMDWLAADPAHAERYDVISAALAEAESLVAELPAAALPAPASAANDDAPVRPRLVRWAGGAVAAALAMTVGVSLWNERAQPYTIATAVGEQRRVQLAEGSEVIVAGGSRIRLDRGDPRVASVERGAALFRIRHDEKRPFTVHAAGMEIVDLGTVFDVATDAGVTRVAVAEGRVEIDPAGAAVTLDPGQAIRAEGGTLARQTVVPADVGRWRSGVLSFDDATLEEVAATLSRTLARRVSVAPGIAKVRFRGTLDAGQAATDPVLLGRLLDVSVRVTNGGWRLEPIG